MSKVRTKLTDKKKKLIIADYIECGNYSEVARKHKVSDTTVRKLVKSDKDSLEKIEQKKRRKYTRCLRIHGYIKRQKKENC